MDSRFHTAKVLSKSVLFLVECAWCNRVSVRGLQTSLCKGLRTLVYSAELREVDKVFESSGIFRH
jgi:hypothetical protein